MRLHFHYEQNRQYYDERKARKEKLFVKFKMPARSHFI